MSVQATSWVWENSQAKGSARLVLLAIADAANREGDRSYQSATSLATMTGISVRSVWRAIDELERLGELVKTGKQGEHQTTVYCIPAVSNWHSDKMARRATQGIAAVPNLPAAVPPIGTQPHKTPKETPVKRAHPADPKYIPKESLREWARKEAPGVDLRTETAQFIDYHLARGSKFVDWDRAWQTWIRNQKKWSAQKQMKPQQLAAIAPQYGWAN